MHFHYALTLIQYRPLQPHPWANKTTLQNNLLVRLTGYSDGKGTILNQIHSRHLKECLRYEVMKSDKPFSWFQVIHKAIKCPDRRFHFWWRIASYLHLSKKNPKLASKINRRLLSRYGLEIQLGARIGKGLQIAHYPGITVSHIVCAGENLLLRQNTTIGAKLDSKREKIIRLGDNVDIGANSCIIGSDLKIGNNVIIGAMSFINKDIPDNCTVYTEKSTNVIKNNSPVNN